MYPKSVHDEMSLRTLNEYDICLEVNTLRENNMLLLLLSIRVRDENGLNLNLQLNSIYIDNIVTVLCQLFFIHFFFFIIKFY